MEEGVGGCDDATDTPLPCPPANDEEEDDPSSVEAVVTEYLGRPTAVAPAPSARVASYTGPQGSLGIRFRPRQVAGMPQQHMAHAIRYHAAAYLEAGK